MMNENSNIQFTTENGHVVIIKGFITGFDKRAINDMYLNSLELNATGTPTPASAVIASNKTTDKSFEIVVVSIDGKTENIVDEIMKLPHRDTAEIRLKVNEVTSDQKKEESTPRT